MKISIDKRTLLLYITAFAAVFNDVIRISGTDWSLFRIIMLLAWVYCFFRRSPRLGKWLLGFFIFAVIDTLQTCYFRVIDDTGANVTLSWYLSYLYFAFCIFSVIFFVYHIFDEDRDHFFLRFKNFIVFCSYAILLVFCYIAIAKHVFGREISLFVSNVNNYGMYLNIVIPIFAIRVLKYKDTRALIFIMISLVAMAVNDCKINIIGFFVELIILMVLERKDKAQKSTTRIIVCLFLISVAVIVVLFVTGKIHLNGHSFLELIRDPVSRLIHGNMYSVSLSSVQYRVNIMIVGIRSVFSTYCLGIGYGNANILMRNVLGDYTIKEKLYQRASISMHNAPLELLIDFGFLALAFYTIWIVRTIKIAKKRSLNDFEIIFCSIVFSMPVWIISPAGITTTYFLFIVLSYFAIAINSKYHDYIQGKVLRV